MNIQKQISVLLVDDDKDTLDAFAEFLELESISVVAAALNGKQAVNLFEQHKPDVVLLDIMMPEFDGFYAIEKIREIDPSAKFLILTADITPKTKKRLQSLDPIKLLYKPSEVDEVVSEIIKLRNGEISVLVDKSTI